MPRWNYLKHKSKQLNSNLNLHALPVHTQAMSTIPYLYAEVQNQVIPENSKKLHTYISTFQFYYQGAECLMRCIYYNTLVAYPEMHEKRWNEKMNNELYRNAFTHIVFWIIFQRWAYFFNCDFAYCCFIYFKNAGHCTLELHIFEWTALKRGIF